MFDLLIDIVPHDDTNREYSRMNGDAFDLQQYYQLNNPQNAGAYAMAAPKMSGATGVEVTSPIMMYTHNQQQVYPIAGYANRKNQQGKDRARNVRVLQQIMYAPGNYNALFLLVTTTE